MDKGLQITSKALEMFMKYGIRSVSMDDISNELGMSKKTLYQFFGKKEDLVMACVQHDLNMDHEMCQEIFKPEKNAIDELLELGQHYLGVLQSINPSAIYDLAKYYPKAWKLMVTEHRGGYYRKVFTENLKKGISQKLFRTEIDVDAATRFYLHRTSTLINDELYPRKDFEMQSLYMESLRYHIRGIGTEKGIKRFEKVMTQLKNQSHAA